MRSVPSFFELEAKKERQLCEREKLNDIFLNQEVPNPNSHQLKSPLDLGYVVILIVSSFCQVRGHVVR